MTFFGCESQDTSKKSKNQSFSHRKDTNGQKAYEKKLCITSYQENADQNHNEILSSVKMIVLRKTHAGKDV